MLEGHLALMRRLWRTASLPVICRGKLAVRLAAWPTAFVSFARPSFLYTILSGIRVQSHSDCAYTHSRWPTATGGALVPTHPSSMCCHCSSSRRACK